MSLTMTTTLTVYDDDGGDCDDDDGKDIPCQLWLKYAGNVAGHMAGHVAGRKAGHMADRRQLITRVHSHFQIPQSKYRNEEGGIYQTKRAVNGFHQIDPDFFCWKITGGGFLKGGRW